MGSNFNFDGSSFYIKNTHMSTTISRNDPRFQKSYWSARKTEKKEGIIVDDATNSQRCSICHQKSVFSWRRLTLYIPWTYWQKNWVKSTKACPKCLTSMKSNLPLNGRYNSILSRTNQSDPKTKKLKVCKKPTSCMLFKSLHSWQNM